MLKRALAIFTILFCGFIVLSFVFPVAAEQMARAIGAGSIVDGLSTTKGRFDAWVTDLSNETDSHIKNLSDTTKSAADAGKKSVDELNKTATQKLEQVKEVGKAADETVDSINATKKNLDKLKGTVSDLTSLSGAQTPEDLEQANALLQKKVDQANAAAAAAKEAADSAKATKAKIDQLKAKLRDKAALENADSTE